MGSSTPLDMAILLDEMRWLYDDDPPGPTLISWAKDALKKKLSWPKKPRPGRPQDAKMCPLHIIHIVEDAKEMVQQPPALYDSLIAGSFTKDELVKFFHDSLCDRMLIVASSIRTDVSVKLNGAIGAVAISLAREVRHLKASVAPTSAPVIISAPPGAPTSAHHALAGDPPQSQPQLQQQQQLQQPRQLLNLTVIHVTNRPDRMVFMPYSADGKTQMVRTVLNVVPKKDTMLVEENLNSKLTVHTEVLKENAMTPIEEFRLKVPDDPRSITIKIDNPRSIAIKIDNPRASDQHIDKKTAFCCKMDIEAKGVDMGQTPVERTWWHMWYNKQTSNW
jgi:hypothetical protein